MAHTETEEDGGGVICGDHLPLHKYIKNSSEYGTIQKNFWMTAEDPKLPQKESQYPWKEVGQKIKI